MLPPSFIDWVLARDLADGVLISGCAGGDCYQRLGSNWTRDRVARERDPYLRRRVPDERVQLSWTRAEQTTARRRVLEDFRTQLTTAPQFKRRNDRAAPAETNSG